VVRIRRLAAALVALAALVTAMRATGVHAQALQRLTVQSFALSADTGKPQVDVPFHLIVTLRVRERVTEIDNLELPILAELELLGDERRLQSAPGGTSYRETITVVARHNGSIAIAPAVLQAIDARDRRAKQYSTNGLTLHVSGGSAPPPVLAENAATGFALAAFRLMLWIGGILCAIVVVVSIFRRRPALPHTVEISEPEPAAPPPVVKARSPREDLRDALTVLRAERSRGTAVRVRALVWRMVGASEGETLADVLQRPEATNPALCEVLRALERAAFTYDEDLPPAIDAASSTLERYLA
jgi:hypothetical protein